MVSAERIQVTLKGGAPWGFRLAGGGAMPLTINKIRKKSAAHTSGVREGDSVISINGIPVHDKSQDEALELVEKSGDTLTLEIFRGDMDEMSRDKPKKTIQIGGGGGGGVEEEGGLVLTATFDDVSNAPTISPQVETEASSELIITASIDDMTSDSFETAVSDFTTGHEFTTTIGDVSESAYDTSTPGFTMTASTDDVTSSSIMVDSITAEAGDLDNIGVVAESEIQTKSSASPSFAQPFLDSKVIAVSPSHLSPQPPRASLSPVSKPVSFSPKPLSPKPKSPVTPVPSPKSPSFIATSPKPVAFSPKPGAMQPIVQNKSPQPFLPTPPSLSPQPSTISSTTKRTSETFDDGQGRVQREVVVTAQKGDMGQGKTVTKRETTTTTTATKKGPSFVQHKASAFEAPSSKKTPPAKTAPQAFAPTPATTKNITSRNGPVPFSASPNHMDNKANIPPALVSSPSIGMAPPPGPAPVFKPSKFVMGQGKRDIPGLYPAGAPAEVAISRDGKENMQPMFQVKNIVGDKGKRSREVWKPNVWLPGQKPSQQQPKKQQKPAERTLTEDFSPYSTFPVPKVQSGVSLAGPRNLKDSRKYLEIEVETHDYDEMDNQGQAIRPNRLHIFAPPVEIHAPEDSGYPDSPYSPYLPYRDDGEIDMGYTYEEGPSSPDSSILRKKNLYADSAFYDTPGQKYPTITEQMKLCKIIANSLTSQANRRARGAKMFMKRKRKSTRWVHDGHEWSSSAGDVANIQDLDSELGVDDGGTKPLFYFKIPNLKNRISSADRKMALTQEQFERLRLQSNKCDHKAVPPTACFNIVADLKASKGKGGRMFEKRKVRVEKYVVDDKNARHAVPRKKLENALNTPVRQEKTPWEAAIAHGGNVDAAFSHIDEMERNQKLNQILKYPQPKKQPVNPVPKPVTPMTSANLFHTSLKADPSMMVQGKNFNRTARGWLGGGEYPVAEKIMNIAPPSRKSVAPAASVQPTIQSPTYGDYNPKIKAWQTPGASPYVISSSSNVQSQQPVQPPRNQASWGQQSWHADVQRPQQPMERWRSQDDIHMRPKSWVSDPYEANTYREEFDYTYVPVDYKFSDDYHSPAYKQPIIPGTDL